MRQLFNLFCGAPAGLFKLIVAIMFTTATCANAYTVDELGEEFNATQLSADEIRYLQFGLALSGRYVGLMDGRWGPGSQRALEDWTKDDDSTPPVKNWEVVLLAKVTKDNVEADGWEQRDFDELDLSIAMPKAMVKKPGSDLFTGYSHKTRSLRYSFNFADFPTVSRFHEWAVARAIPGTTPYVVRRDNAYITSVEQKGGDLLYVRSDQKDTGWSTVIIAASRRDKNLLSAAAGSIKRARAARMALPLNGNLNRGIASLGTVLAETKPGENRRSARRTARAGVPPPSSASTDPSRSPDTPRRRDGKPARLGSGTGFVVSDRGHLLTNAHVIQDCKAIQVNGRPVAVAAEDKNFDLALLKDSPAKNAAIAQFSPRPAPLNADITVAGYPLTGLLSGLNVTRGSVSSLKGMAGDSIRMQISAPVQPGNSGGPAVDEAGRVVGVVVSKLDAQRVSEVIGDIPQNVNFAVRGEIAKLFMFQNGVEPAIADDDAPTLPPVEIARQLEAVTRLVECLGSAR